ncbi:hypothetical protein L228DRAFT_274237 [Xylona heveae TC161]|uniref:Mitochondrial ribosomal protein subunit L20 n=1 Tax=Xylona heveae (strain CBS 132557 / TC161) TaxID=1328760 RepID=A0A164ZF51_XYLHT|nr:hypothetical protein L228DRAFT_274237 [Xylona heveae TC161]KZF19025.1 hypothetical protein L228DRAFT_274237 [Xylona heveae TC161]
MAGGKREEGCFIEADIISPKLTPPPGAQLFVQYQGPLWIHFIPIRELLKYLTFLMVATAERVLYEFNISVLAHLANQREAALLGKIRLWERNEMERQLLLIIPDHTHTYYYFLSHHHLSSSLSSSAAAASSSPLLRMHSAAVRRPFAGLVAQWPSASTHHSIVAPSIVQNVCRRHESSFRRTKQRLRLRPDETFGAASSDVQQDHIVFNPPSSAPSVYHTPALFLPRSDRRRELFAGRNADETAGKLPPPVRKPYEKSYHLTEADIEEVRRLRSENPAEWTRARLADKFNCSSLFIGIICEASKEHKAKQQQILDTVKSKWGRKRREAREDRARRRDAWSRDE